MTRIFISHSSRDATLTGQVAAALVTAAAGHAGFDVLLDSQCLQAGLPWSSQLDAMLADAHAGLLLFTRAALDGPEWILKETLILTWRQSLDPDFRVFYVLLDDVTTEQLDAKGFGPAELTRIQWLKDPAPSAIAEEIRKALPDGLIQPATPLEELAGSLATHLKFDAIELGRLTAKLKAPSVSWRPSDKATLIRSIAARILTGELGDGNDLGELIKWLKSLAVADESLPLILRWVAPFWIPHNAAGQFAGVVREVWAARRDRSATINGQYLFDYTARMFIEKVQPLNYSCRVAKDIGPSATSSDADYYTKAICTWLREQDKKEPPGKQVGYPADDAKLIKVLQKDKPFLCVPLEAPDEDTVITLRTRFPTVVFLLHADDEQRPVYTGVPVVNIRIGEKTEEDEYFIWRDAMRAL